MHTVSHFNDTTHDISLLSDTSISDPTSSQISSPTPSQIENNPFNPPQGLVTNLERLLSQAHWNHSFNVVNSTPSFQSSIPLSFTGTPCVINLSSNSPTPDPDQHFHHCIGKHPDTTQTYPTLPLKLDPEFIVSPPALFGDHNNGEKLHNWAKQRVSKTYKITTVRKHSAHKLLKQSKITFSVEIVVEQDKLIFHTQAAAPTIFRAKTNPSPFNCQEYTIYLIDTKNTAGYFVFYNTHSGLSYTCPLQILFTFSLFLFFSCPLKIKQPIKVDQHNISRPETGLQDLVVTHYDCFQSISKICSIINSTKLANARSNQLTFKSSQHK